MKLTNFDKKTVKVSLLRLSNSSSLSLFFGTFLMHLLFKMRTLGNHFYLVLFDKESLLGW